MPGFEDLVASRKDWIETVLKPWCRNACEQDLKKAETEWGDIAGRVDPDSTLWTWAWSRFPDLVHDEFAGVDETYPVQVTLKDTTVLVGYPNNRQSKNGRLVLMCPPENSSNSIGEEGPFSIDDVESVLRRSDL